MEADVILIVGTYVFSELFPVLSGIFAENAQVIYIDLGTDEIVNETNILLAEEKQHKLNALFEGCGSFRKTR